MKATHAIPFLLLAAIGAAYLRYGSDPLILLIPLAAMLSFRFASREWTWKALASLFLMALCGAAYSLLAGSFSSTAWGVLSWAFLSVAAAASYSDWLGAQAPQGEGGSQEGGLETAADKPRSDKGGGRRWKRR